MKTCKPRLLRACVAMLASLSGLGCSQPSVEAAFSPSLKARELVESTIGSAAHSIDMAMFIINSEFFASCLADAHKRGVKIRIVVDNKACFDPTAVRIMSELRAEGISVRINKHYAAVGARMHTKYNIVDNTTVQTGSFNYKIASEFVNADNVLVFRDNPAIAAKYHKDWQKQWDESNDEAMCETKTNGR